MKEKLEIIVRLLKDDKITISESLILLEKEYIYQTYSVPYISYGNGTGTPYIIATTDTN